MMKKSDLFQTTSNSNKPTASAPSASNLVGSTGFAGTPSLQPQNVNHDLLGFGAPIAALKLDAQISGLGAPQTSSFSKQLKIQQIYSDQASQAIQNHGIPSQNQSVGQGVLAGAGQASGPGQSLGWDRTENGSTVTPAHQLRQTRPPQISSLPERNPQNVFGTQRGDPQLNLKKSGLQIFEKQASGSIYPSLEASQGEKSTIPMRSRSPHSTIWGHQQTSQKLATVNSSTSMVPVMGLALKAHPISDTKRQQPSVGTQPGTQPRGQPFNSTIWGGATLLDAGSSQQRPAGKASGLTYTQNEHGAIVEQSNRETWKSTTEWLQNDEKSGGHTNVFSQAGKQQQLNFNQTRLKARQTNFVASRDGMTGSQGLASGSAPRNQYSQFLNTPQGNNAPVGSANAQLSDSDQFKNTNFANPKYRQSMDAQQPKPQLIANQVGSQYHLKGAQRLQIQTRVQKGKQSLMKEALQVTGLQMTKPDQQLQSTSNSMMGQPTLELEDFVETTPEAGKDKYKKRVISNAQSEAGASILIASTKQGKAIPGSVFLNSQDLTLQEQQQQQKRGQQASEGGKGQDRRAESMGKQKLNSKLVVSARTDDQPSLEGFLHVKHLKQTLEVQGVKKGKKSRHNSSFQGGMRPLKNAPFKQALNNSTTNSQLNDSGHGSGGTVPPGVVANLTEYGLNTTTVSSEPETQFQAISSKNLASRRQVHAPSNNPVIFLHPTIQNRNQQLQKDRPISLPSQLSPAGAPTAKVGTDPVGEVLTGGEQKMTQLYQQFKDKCPAPISPKNSKQTPISSRKVNKKSKLVLRGEVQGATPYALGIKSDRLALMPEEAATEESYQKKESVKHRELKNMIRQNKYINNLKVSSFSSQERDGEHVNNTEEENDDDDDEELFQREQAPRVHDLQQLQKHIHIEKDSVSEDTLSRDENEPGGGGVENAMAIFQQITPSGLASSSTQKNEQTSSYHRADGLEKNAIVVPKEFSLAEDEVVISKQTSHLKDSNVAPFKIKERAMRQEKKQMHPIFSKASLSKERQLESVENLSRHQSSSDSSFQQAFETLIRESEGLKWQLEEILLNRLTPADPVYTEFVGRIVAKNKQRQQKILASSMPAQRRKDDFLDARFTQERVVQHIENQKKKRHSEHIYRPFHSDMSRSRFFSNSVREDHPSITSPNLSGTVGPTQLRGTQLLFHRHERRRRLHRYLSFSNGVTYHAKSAQQASALLPELSSVGLHRYSFCQGGGRLFGVSDSLSLRLHQPVTSSNSNNTVPTPIQQENKKLEDLKDATNRVKILPPATANKLHAEAAATPQGAAATKTDPSAKLQLIYEKLNMNDKKAVQMKALLPLAKQQATVKQENNFFRLSNVAPPVLQQVPEPAAACKKIFGKVIEWQIGKQLGSGTTGEVYEALNINTGMTFAVKMIKLMHPYLGLDQQKVKSVKKEIQRYKQLEHKHIVKYFDSEIIENNVLCIYLEYVYKSVAQMCQEYGKIGEKNARMYTQQVLRALAYLHEQGVVHGDLKGANVLVSQDGKEIKLCDMGNSLLLKQPAQPVDQQASARSLLSVNSLVYSSPAWMAPETHVQKVGKRSDIWSLGCLVVEMLTGQNPWGKRLDGESNVHVALQRKLANHERPQIPDEVTEECRNFINRCLQHRAEQRPQAVDLLEDPWIRNKDHALVMSPQR